MTAKVCEKCKHAQDKHHNGRGMCSGRTGGFICSCSRFKTADVAEFFQSEPGHDCFMCGQKCMCTRQENHCWHECADCDCGHGVEAHCQPGTGTECNECSCAHYTPVVESVPEVAAWQNAAESLPAQQLPMMDYEEAGKEAYAEQRVVRFRADPTGTRFEAHPDGHYVNLDHKSPEPVAPAEAKEKECGNCGHPRHTDDPNWQCKECLKESEVGNRRIDMVCAAYCPTTDDEYVRSVFPDAWEAPYSHWIWTREPKHSDTATDRPTCLSTAGWRTAAQYIRANPVAEPKPTPSTSEPLWVQYIAADVDRQFAMLPIWKQRALLEIFTNRQLQPDSSSIPGEPTESQKQEWYKRGFTDAQAMLTPKVDSSSISTEPDTQQLMRFINHLCGGSAHGMLAYAKWAKGQR